ncbi:MAG: phosphate ABC transporter substrate-binding protein [Coriobacteriia bacterium]|nr:phosphate ABC transporter substrate-binding protein [Coriobacteriia bacterium]
MYRSKSLRLAAVAIAVVMLATVVSPAFAFAATLKLSGSTTVQPLAVQWAAAYHRLHPGTSITVAGGGSGTGFKDAASGKSDLGMSSREKASTDAASIVMYPVARDALAIIVHKNGLLANTSEATIKKIFTGKITNWRQVSSKFPNKAIVLVGRTGASGTYTYFKESFLSNSRQSSRTKMYASNGMVRSAVARNRYAIGYVSVAFVNSSVRGVKIGGVAPTKANAISGRYKYRRYLYLLSNGAATGEALAFINYAKSSAGQAIAGREYLRLR